MKTIRHTILAMAALALIVTAHAQIDTSALDLVPTDQIPRSGTFWLESGVNLLGFRSPPLPCIPAGWTAPVYAFTNGQFLIDDTVPSATASLNISASPMLSTPPLPGGTNSDNSYPPPPPPPVRNYLKYMAQAFLTIDTNAAATTDTNLYKACTSFPPDTNTAPTLQITRYGPDAVLIKANHFDYSTELNRDFALIICDNVETPIWKTIDVSGTSDAIDGWLVQGLVSRYDVTDPMFMMVTNLDLAYNAFFRATPYGGPTINLTGPQPYDTVSNTITLQAGISDLSGATNQQLTVSVNGFPCRYSVGPSNTINIDTRYSPIGYVTVSATVANDTATTLNPTNPPTNQKIDFDGTASLPLDFENSTYVYFPGDMSETNVGTNYIIYGVTPPQYIAAWIQDLATGRILKSFSGYDATDQYVELDWNFTEADGITPFTNDQYVVTFTASASPISGPSPRDAGGSTTLTTTNTIERSHVRAAGWVISTFEEVDPLYYDWLDTALAQWYGATESMYETLYAGNFASQTQYYSWQIGSGRNTPTSPQMPIHLNPATQGEPGGWRSTIRGCVTNHNYSDFNYMGHGNGYLIGGGEYDPNTLWVLNYVNVTLGANDMLNWCQAGASGPNSDKRWKMRKVCLWACYSARTGAGAGSGLYGNWHSAFGIYDSQMDTLSGKNAGLFFNDKLNSSGYGGPPATLPEVAAEFDKIWVMGANAYPGGADPNYSIQFAYNVTRGIFSPDLDKAAPVLIGCPFLPFAGTYDAALLRNDFSQVKQ